VRSWPQFLLRDRPGGPSGPRLRDFGDWQTGLEDADGTPKPAYASFRTPVVALCRGARRHRLLVWGRWRGVADATAVVQRETARGWVAAGRPLRAATASAAVSATGPWRAGARVRLHWTAPDGNSADSPAIAPQPCQTSRRHRRKHR
jgi:hypothetical protein